MSTHQPSPLVSVIVPAFNAEVFIGETLRSVLSQTYSDLEVLVVDDGSRDCTPAIVEEFLHKDSRVQLLRQANRGVAAARNLAISSAHGEFIAPVDADDIWFPQKIEKQVLALGGAGPRAGLSYTWSVSIDEHSTIIDTGPKWDLAGEVYQPLVLRNFIGNASVPMIRRSALQNVGGYNERLRSLGAEGCEDWDLSLRIAEKFEFCLVPEYLVGYRCYAQSMSYNHEAMGRSYALVMEDVQNRHPELPSDVYRWSAGNFFLYLTHKTNVSGDLQSSLTWLLRAVREDPAALLLPWVSRCLLNRLLRKLVFTWTGNPRVWHRWRKCIQTPCVLTYDQLPHASRRSPCLWDRLQVQRWAMATNYRSFSCY